ncbi:MAG: hypothetical protein AB1847_04320 [bacterium]
MELTIKDVPDELYRQLKLVANKDVKSIDEVVIEAIRNHCQEREIAYRKEMLHFDQDKGYQLKDQ